MTSRTASGLTKAVGAVALIGLAAAVATSLPGSPSTVGADPTDLTAIFIAAQHGEDLAGYKQAIFIEPGNGWTFATSVNNAKTITVSAGNGQEGWGVSLGGPGSTLITTGTHEVTQSIDGEVSLSLLGPNTYCSAGSVGRVVVHQVEMTNPTVVARLAASFEIHCLGSVAGRVGEVRYHSTGIDLPALTLSNEQLTFASGQTQSVTVSNRGTTVQTVSAQLGGAFPDAFAITSNDCGTLQPGSSCMVGIQFVSAGPTTRPSELQITDQTLIGTQYTALEGQPSP